MAWDARRRRADSIPWNLRRSESGVDELDLKRSNSFSSRVERKIDIETPLSPIQEEKEPETCSAPLQVNLTIRFFDPVVRSVYHRTYSSSQSFVPTDQICRGMLRRIEHCSEELITRKDSGALTPIQCLRKGPKDLRFEMSFQIYRKGHSGAWAERTFESYQKQPLTSDSAMDLLRCTHSIIGIFLRRHDDRFRWIDEPSREYFPEKPATFKPSLTGPPNLSCVPRSRFIEYTQKWEVVPGYALELTFESRNPTRRQPDIRKVLKVGSTQTAPLTLGLGEDLLWQAHRAVEYVLDSRKEAFDIEHANCEGLDGVSDCGCQHFDEDALKVELRPVNNLGPTYEHLYRNIRSRLRLFEHPTGRDCDEFIAMVRARFHQLRDGTDKKLEVLNDFDFRIADLIGHGWHVKNPAHFVLDGTRRRTRRSIEALLDRIRTGVGDVLRGHDVAIRMIAYSRGHLILDKALISRNHQSSPDHIPSMVPEDEQKMYTDKEERPASASPSAQDSAIGIDHDSECHALGRTLSLESTYEERVPPVISEGQREDAPRSEKPFGLKPAAEVKRARYEADDTNSSILTYSSMPALTESRTPSPDHSLLITPTCVRDSSPRPSSLHFFHDSESTRSRMATPSPKSKVAPVPVSLTGPKSSVPSSALPFRRPVTPVKEAAQGSVYPASPSTPKSYRGPRFAEASAITGTIQEEAQQSSKENRETQLAMSGDMTIESALHPISVPDLKAADVAGSDTSENTQEDLPVEGWLLHSDEAVDEEEPVPLAGFEEPEGMTDVDQCDSSKVLEPHIEATTTEQETDPAVFEPQSPVVTEQVNAVACPAPTEVDEQFPFPLGRVEDVTPSSGPTETSRIGLVEVGLRDEDQCGDYVGDLPIENEMTASGDDYLENAGSFQPQDPLGVSVSSDLDSRRNSVSEVLEPSHVEPFSESVIDVRQVTETTERTISEIEEQTELGQNEDSTSEAASESSGVIITSLQTHAIGPEAISEFSDVTNIREGASNALICVKDHVSISVPTLPREQADSEVTSPLAWKRDITQPFQSPRPTLTHLGLGNGYLHRLSPFARFSTGVNKSSSSLSSSSEWEDYASEAHQSSDSVNTVGLAPSPSEQDDGLLQVPVPPRRIGKPTAGLLGLQDSRRGNIGIRGALTGTHAFDKASVTSSSSSPRYEAHDEHVKLRTDTVETGVKTQRKRPSSSHQRLVHLRHNKSNGSVVFPGAHVKSPKMNRRESKEPKVRERNKPTGEENSKPVVVEHRIDDSEGRFPRAMAIVAGLAMFSSMVNANPA
ncbi:hypothetical protein SLS53_003198 [Cytospora paraplurivora]|uniref:Pt repeat family protein n=1 Tax=Cytospora paraplurivora TaxID=2898453 RepID=A0AAN9YJS8_9PEZI